AVLSLAPGLQVQGFIESARSAGWDVTPAAGDAAIPFALTMDGRERVRAWRGALGPVLERVVLVLGQAGTANEAAAAAGVPVVAFENPRERKPMWYRRRQRALLGDALAVFPERPDDATAAVSALLRDPQRRAHMSATGRMRMGEPGAARRIAERIAATAREIA
ncbi:MAG: hypothetical protein WB615_14760, partial [Candidatus Tumulicola sp.]